VMDTMRNHTDYDGVCSKSDRIAPDGIDAAKEGQSRTCEISGVPAFFSYRRDVFDASVQNDNDVITYLSVKTYPDQRPVSRSTVMGNFVWKPPEYNDDGTEKPNTVEATLESAESFTLVIILPDNDVAEVWDSKMKDVVLDFKRQWQAEGSELVVEVTTENSFSEEFKRTIIADLPLIPTVFFVMSAFTALVFSKRHKVESRSILGFAAVITVGFSVMTGFGMMFIAAVPFTSMTQLLPFLIFGTCHAMVIARPSSLIGLNHSNLFIVLVLRNWSRRRVYYHGSLYPDRS